MANAQESRSQTVLAVVVALMVLSTIFVSLRMVSRLAIVRKISSDDYLMVSAWVLAFGLSFAICWGTSVGLGKHEEHIPDFWRPALKKSEYAFSVLYNPVLMATKSSILLFYLRLATEQRIFKWATILTLVVVNIAGLALTLMNILQCIPVGAAFQTPIPDNAHCTNIVTLYLASAPVNIITDLAILFLPMPMLTAMRLPRKQKIILVVTFGFGAFVAVVDVIRIAYLQEAFTNRIANVQAHIQDTNTDSRNTTDFSWYASFSYMWTAIEVHVGIMCACVPALKPLAARFLPHVLRDKDDSAYSMGAGTATVNEVDMSGPQRLGSVPEDRPAKPERASTAGPSMTIDQNDRHDSTMDMMDFLTTPDMNELPEPIRRTQTAATARTAMTHGTVKEQNFFDFVNIQQKKSMVTMSNRESLFPVAMVTVLFFLWGFAYGFLDILNARFQRVAALTTGQTIGIHSAYFGAYLVGPLTFGRLVLKHWGFKACYIVGLSIYACGTLVFWPSAVLTSFPAFLVSNFIVGLGLSTLEIAANAFTALCGPPQYAETRLNLSQGVQGIGTVVSPLLAQKVLFGPVTDASSLVDVQWTYLGIALFVILLALVYYYIPLPEATDEDFEKASYRTDGANHVRIGPVKIIALTLALGVFSQWCYVGAQEAVSTSFGSYLSYVNSDVDVVNWQAIGHGTFAIGRFLAAFSNIWIKPRYYLTVSYIAVITFSALLMNWKGVTPSALILVLYFFEGPLFSLIYAMCLRGMGRHTKDAAAVMTAAISGGAVFPPIMHAVQLRYNVQYAYSAVIGTFAFGAILPLYLMLVPAAKKQVDPITREQAQSGLPTDRRDSHFSTSSSTKLGRIFKRRRKEADSPTAEHLEEKPPSSLHDL